MDLYLVSKEVVEADHERRQIEAILRMESGYLAKKSTNYIFNTFLLLFFSNLNRCKEIVTLAVLPPACKELYFNG